MKVSALILTFNEEKNLPACLGALAWCDDVVVVDSGSTDRTVEIATGEGARVLKNPFKDFADQRNFGLTHGAFRHDWVLHLDADEIVTPDFIAALDRLAPTEGIDGYRVPSKLMLFGQWLKRAGMYPTYQVRLGHRERLRFVQVGHGQREDAPPERIGLFPEPYLHYAFSNGMKHWLERHIRYARDEAALIEELRTQRAAGGAMKSSTERRRAAKAAAAKLPLFLRAPARFVYIYLAKRGFLDGKAGLVYALMLSVYEGMTAVFAYEARFAAAGKTNAPPQNSPKKT